MTAYVEIRCQHSRGSSNGFGGPDTYFAVQCVPDGAKRLRSLRQPTAEKRGITIIYCGEGYSRNQGNRSSYHRAHTRAIEIAAQVNSGRSPSEF